MTKIWVIIGKLALLIGVVVGLTEISQFLKSDYAIDAKGINYKFMIPEGTRGSIQVDSTSNYRLTRFGGVWEINIENTGSMEVQELSLETPLQGVYQINKSDGSSLTGEFFHNVDLGSLRPSNRMSVVLWSDSYSDYNRSETRITHPNGVVNIKYPEQVRGLHAWITRNMSPIWLFLLILFIIFVIMAQFVFSPTKTAGSKDFHDI